MGEFFGIYGVTYQETYLPLPLLKEGVRLSLSKPFDKLRVTTYTDNKKPPGGSGGKFLTV
jgi:hypothetical protein